MPRRRETRAPLLGVLFSAAVLSGPALLAIEARTTPTPKHPPVVKSLTKEQIKALTDNEPIDVNGRVTTKAQVMSDVQKARSQADAWHAQQLSAALGRFERASAAFRSRQKTKLEADNIAAVAAVSKLRQEIENEDQKKAGKTPTPCAAPHIVNVSVGSGAIYPGMAAFLVGGSCFGAQAGVLRIEGQFPGGALTPPIGLWKDSLIIVAIPAGLTGIPDQTAFVKVVRANGGQSNAVPVAFKGTRETRLLHASDTIPICSSNALINDCSPTPGQTFDGVHSTLFDSADGEDRIKVSLRNGWILSDKDWTFGEWLGGGSAHISAWPQGQSVGDVRIAFSVNTMGYIRYHAWLYIEGPVGTSSK